MSKLFHTPQIKWHCVERQTDDKARCDRVLSIDASSSLQLLASAGADPFVNLWQMRDRDPYLIAQMEGHCDMVNVVRWSPSGYFLASGGQDGVIIIWRCSPERNKIEIYNQIRIGSAVYDLEWNPEGTHIIIGLENDGAWIAYAGKKGKVIERLEPTHKHIVCGVTWGCQILTKNKGKSQLKNGIITVSHDQTMKTWYQLDKNFYKFKLNYSVLTYDRDICNYNYENEDVSLINSISGMSRQFVSENTCKSFFRRPSTSPCGNYVAVPASQIPTSFDSKYIVDEAVYTCNIYGSYCLKNPVWALRTFSGTPSTVTRFLNDVVQFNDTLAQIIAFGCSDGSVETWAIPEINSIDTWSPKRIWGALQCHQQAITDLSWQQCKSNTNALISSSTPEDIDENEEEDGQLETINRSGSIKPSSSMTPIDKNTTSDNPNKRRAQLLPVGDVVTFGVHELSFDTSVIAGTHHKDNGRKAILVISSSDGYVSFLSIPLPIITTEETLTY